MTVKRITRLAAALIFIAVAALLIHTGIEDEKQTGVQTTTIITG